MRVVAMIGRASILTGICVLLMVCSPGSRGASDTVKDGHDWYTMSKAQQEAFATILIYKREGIGIHRTDRIRQCAREFADAVTSYYGNNQVSLIRQAVTSAWPRAAECLRRSSDETRLAIQKTYRKGEQKWYPNGICEIAIGDSRATVFEKIRASDLIKFRESYAGYCERVFFISCLA